MANPPTVNVMPAGQAVDIKFTLGGDQGENIFRSIIGPTGVPYYPLTEPAVQNQIKHTTAYYDRLSYSSTTQSYTYLWVTDSSWKGTYRRFHLNLNDNSEHFADFKFA